VNRDRKNISDDLLVKYLLAEATQAEQDEVLQWIATSDENRRYYEHLRLIWEQSRKLAASSTIDEQEAWQRFQQKARKVENATPVIIPAGKASFNWVKVAAILLVVVVCGALIYNFTREAAPRMLVLQSGNNVMIDTLPDGSVVTLNKRSSLSYPETFKGDMRSVKLEGEAFFNITPDKSKPFIIDANGTAVKVVGTSFNVKTTEDKTEVIVETGVVEVSKKKKAVKLNPHQKATVLKGSDEPIKEDNSDELYNYYKTNEFICDHTPLWRLADVLSDAYKVHIVITNNLGNRQLTGIYKNMSLDELLDIVAISLNVRIEKKGDEIIIK